MSLDAMKIAWSARGVTPVEKLALIYIADSAGDSVWVQRNDRLAYWALCTLSEAAAAVETLYRSGYLGHGVRNGRGPGFWVGL